MRPDYFLSSSLSVLALMLSGCAVPQPALDQANNSANLAHQLTDQVNNLKASTSASLSKHAADITDWQTRVANVNTDALNNLAIDRSDGDSRAALFDSLQALSDSRAKTALQEQASLTALKSQLATMTDAAGFDTKALVTFQKQESALGLPRSSKETQALVKSFALQVAGGASSAAGGGAAKPAPAAPGAAVPAVPAASAPAAPAPGVAASGAKP